MKKTVKELKEYLKYQIIPVKNSVSKNVYNATMEKIYRMFCKIESELIEKDKEIELLTKKRTQLFKEDFYWTSLYTGGAYEWVLDDRDKYNILPNKEE